MANKRKPAELVLEKDDWEQVGGNGNEDDWVEVSPNASGLRALGSGLPTNLMPRVPSPGQIGPETTQMLQSAIGGFADPLTLGYYPRLLSEKNQASLMAARSAYPKTSGVMNLIGSLSPAGPLNLFRGARGAMSGIKSGAIAGAAYDPGGDDYIDLSGRAVRGVVGAGLGGLSDAAGALKSYLAGGFNTRSAARQPGFSRDVKDTIDKTIKEAKNEFVAPRAADVRRLVDGKKTNGQVSGKSVEIGPAVVDQIAEHFPQYAQKLRSRMVADAAGQMRVKIPGQQALKLRQKLDDMADYRKQKALSDEAVAGGEKIKALADVFRGRLEKLAPGVGRIQGELSKGIRSINDLERRAVDPVALAKTQKGIKGGDTRSLIEDVEGMAKNKGISQTGSRIRLAEKMEPQMTMRPLQIPQELFKAKLLGAGAAASGIEKMGNLPVLRHTNPRDAFLLQSVQPRTEGSSDVKEMVNQAMNGKNDWSPVVPSERLEAAKKFGYDKNVLAAIDNPAGVDQITRVKAEKRLQEILEESKRKQREMKLRGEQ